MNEVLRAIFERRSIRKYTGEPVKKREDIEQVMQAGLYAPTGGRRTVALRRADG
jgi:nitroreductase